MVFCQCCTGLYFVDAAIGMYLDHAKNVLYCRETGEGGVGSQLICILLYSSAGLSSTKHMLYWQRSKKTIAGVDRRPVSYGLKEYFV